MGRDGSEEGISNAGLIFSMAGFLVVLLIVAIVVSVTLPKNGTTTTTTTVGSTVVARAGSNQASAQVHSSTSTTASRTGTGTGTGTGAAAEVAACHSDVSDVQTALAAYQATNGSYPTPPAAWSAATYPTNFGPLTNAAPPGPFLKMPPGDDHYVILWDSSGRIWVEATGTFTPAYDATNDGAVPGTCTRVAR